MTLRMEQKNPQSYIGKIVALLLERFRLLSISRYESMDNMSKMEQN